MSLLRDALQLISTQSGALIYYLVTLFAIQLILGVAIGHWERRRDEASARLLAMGAGLFLTRTILMLAAVLDRVGLASADVVLPPLERFLHLTTVVLAIWVFLPILERLPRGSDGVLLITLVIAAGTYAAFATLWPGAEAVGVTYNGYWQERVWEVSTTIILALALVGSLSWKGSRWGWLSCLLTVWLAGHGLQLVTPLVDANTPGWVRLGDLAVLPLLAGLVYGRALSSTRRPAEKREESALGSIGILRAVQSIDTEESVESAMELAASSVARMVDADMVAIGLAVPGPVDVVRIVALYPPRDVMLADQEPTLLVSKHPLLATALESRQPVPAAGEGKIAGAARLYHRLGFDAPGPLLIQPLIAKEEVLGAMLVGNPESRGEWSSGDEEIVQVVAAALAVALAGDEEPEGMAAADLEQARRMAQRAQQLEAELKQQRQRTEELAAALRQREQEVDENAEASAALAFWEEEVRELAEAREQLQAQLSHWQQKARSLAAAKADLEGQLKRTRPPTGESDHGRFGGILVGDADGRVIMASQATQRLLGRSQGELMDTPLEAMFDELLWKKTIRRLLGEGEGPGSVSAVRLNVRGRMVQAELARIPQKGSWPGRIAAAFYLTEGDTIQSEMVASLVQELRTPMTSITGYADLLLGEKVGILGESQRQFLLRIEANIKRMEALLNDLIKATDVDAGQIELAPEPVDVGDVIEDALGSFSARFHEKGLRVHADVSHDLPPVHTDRDSLSQVVHNLISNAALASKPGTEIRLCAQVEERPDGLEELPGYVLVSVTDTGGGIAAEDQQHVFQRFYRAENPLIEGLGETGVGLSVAKALVEANGGRIWVESEMGVGSTFRFILPLTPPEEDARREGIPEGSDGRR
ncbi:MAG: ATP-binding protein [Chloroflexota bacterium]